MPKLKTITETYDFCLAQGNLKNLEEINFEKINSLLKNADINLSSAQILIKSLNQNSSEWLNVFTLSYEAFRIYAEALLLFQKISSSNHLCVFSALCLKYPELELDWYFLERIRTKRHGLNYYGESIIVSDINLCTICHLLLGEDILFCINIYVFEFSYQDWKSVALQLELYLSLLRKEVEKRLVL